MPGLADLAMHLRAGARMSTWIGNWKYGSGVPVEAIRKGYGSVVRKTLYRNPNATGAGLGV